MSPHFRDLCAIFIALSAAALSSAASVDYKVRNAPGASTADTYLAVRNALTEVSLQKREYIIGNTTLSRRWSDITLLKLGHKMTAAEIKARPLEVSSHIEVLCTECYIEGTAFAKLSIGDNVTSPYNDQAVNNFTAGVERVADEAKDYIVDYFKGVFDKLEDGIDWSDFELPPFNQNASFNIPEIPDCNLNFKFDGLELYLNMNTILGAEVTYEIPLFRPVSPLGISITDDLKLGVFFAIDLILSAQGELDINNGFHIKFEDGVGINITLFANDISDITFNGGQFEFIPVTINSGNVVFSAVLRVGVHAGFNLITPGPISNLVSITNITDVPTISGGIEVAVFANVAEFITNVTYTPEDDDCKHNVVQSYQLALGARAGATVAIGRHILGPVPETTIPIWQAVMGSICAEEKTPTTADAAIITTAPEDRKRNDLSTITTQKIFTYTGLICSERGRVNCPASLQWTSRSTETRMIVTAVRPSSNFELATAVMDTAPSLIAFKRGAQSIPTISGSPVSYVPPAPSETSKIDGFIDDLEDAADDVGNALDEAVADAKETYKDNKPLIIGLACGLGGAALLAVITGLIFVQRRRAAKQDMANRGTYSVPGNVSEMVETPTTPALSVGYMDYKAVKSARVEVADLGFRSPNLRSP